MGKITIPEYTKIDDWYGFKRYHFTFENYNAWIAEPETPAADGRWSWCMMWPEAYVERVGAILLLKNGFYRVYIELFETRANPAGVAVMERFHDYLISCGFAEKTMLTGLSWGGFFSLRYATNNPHRIAAMYLDAPVCSAADMGVSSTYTDRNKTISDRYGLTTEELKTSKLNPLNDLEGIAKADFPIYALIGQDDMVVRRETNFDILERKLKAMGKEITVVRRLSWGHHPHGLDDPADILNFHLKALE